VRSPLNEPRVPAAARQVVSWGTRHAAIGFFGTVVLVVACGPTSSGVEGVSCNQDSGCNEGLQCLSESLPGIFFDAAPPDGGCESIGSVCLSPCTTDADCDATLGSGYFCSGSSCGAAIPTCQPIVDVGDGGADAGDAAEGGSQAAPEASDVGPG
jgi:hypothetical protein